GQYFFAVGVIVRVISSVALIALAIRANLQKVIGEGFWKEPFVRVQVSVLRSDVPRSLKRQPARKALSAPQLDRTFLELGFASGFVIHFNNNILPDKALGQIHEDVRDRFSLAH